MEVIVAAEGGRFPSYPYWKVVIASDRAEVAELPCESATGENLFFHEDLVSRLREKNPELAREWDFTAGWLTQSGDEALLSLWILAGGMSADDVSRIGGVMRDWCSASGVRRLTIADASRREGSSEDAKADWSLDNWLVS